MIIYSVCLALTYLTKHNTLGSSMLSRMVEFHSFLWLSNIPLNICMCIYGGVCTHTHTHTPNIIFIHSSVDRHLGCFHILAFVYAAAKSLCDPIDDSPPDSPVPGILQARTLEWVAISFSNAWKWKVKVKSLSCVRLFATPWTAAHQAPLPMGFSRQEDWNRVPSPSPAFVYSPLWILEYLYLLESVS